MIRPTLKGTANRKRRPITEKDLQELFVALACRLDALGQILSSRYPDLAIQHSKDLENYKDKR